MQIEKHYVQEVYSEIAPHFNDTRFCIWDFVRIFLNDKTNKTKGIDIGCGNGKNMLVNRELDIIGTDICPELLEICRQKGLTVSQHDCCNLQFSINSFDYALAIAVFHHMGTDIRRIKALSEMIRVLKVNGKGVFSVWSIENQEKKRNFVVGDNFVTWERRSDKKKFKRFYYIFTKDMIESLLKKFSQKIIVNKIFNERGNWVVIFTKI